MKKYMHARKKYYNKRKKIGANKILNRQKEVCLITLIVNCIIMLIGAYVSHKYGTSPIETLCDDAINDSQIDILLGQISVTFITISVMSVLSDNSIIVLWENIVRKILIAPTWKGFYAYTIYSFSTLLFGSLALLLGMKVLFLLYFVADIIVIMLLTITMVSLYFKDTDDIAFELELEFDQLLIHNSELHGKLKSDDKIIYGYGLSKKMMQIMACNDEISKIIDNLKKNTLLAFETNDEINFQRNMNFYEKYSHIFPSDFIVDIFVRVTSEQRYDIAGEILGSVSCSVQKNVGCKEIIESALILCSHSTEMILGNLISKADANAFTKGYLPLVFQLSVSEISTETLSEIKEELLNSLVNTVDKKKYALLDSVNRVKDIIPKKFLETYISKQCYNDIKSLQVPQQYNVVMNKLIAKVSKI